MGKISSLGVLVFFSSFVQTDFLGAQDLTKLQAGVVKIMAKPPMGRARVGTGFIVRLDKEAAYIITAAHVVAGDPHPQVEFFTKRNVPVRAAVTPGAEGGDEVRGLALLMVNGKEKIPSGLVALPLASGLHFLGGEDIVLIGFPRGVGPWAIIKGNISSRQGRDIYFSPTVGEGNSGGPIIQNGKVVGLVGAGGQAIGQGVTVRSIEDYLEGFGITVQESTASGTAEKVQEPAPPSVAKVQPTPSVPIKPGTEVSRRWEDDVFQACQRLIEKRYPFSSLGQDAAFSDVVSFFHPDDGVLWKFYQTELKGFVDEAADQWRPRTWNGVNIALSVEFLQALQHARFLSESLFPKGASDPESTFELYPHPPQGGVSKTVSEIRLDIGGQSLRYRMEPQEWHEMKWPGPTPATGAVLQVQVGTAWVTKEYKDWWGFFRLLHAGRIVPVPNTNRFHVQWDLLTLDGKTVQIQYELRTRNSKIPLLPGVFEQFRCVHLLP